MPGDGHQGIRPSTRAPGGGLVSSPRTVGAARRFQAPPGGGSGRRLSVPLCAEPGSVAKGTFGWQSARKSHFTSELDGQRVLPAPG